MGEIELNSAKERGFEMDEDKAKDAQFRNAQGVVDAIYKAAEIPGTKDYWYNRADYLEKQTVVQQATIEQLQAENARLKDVIASYENQPPVAWINRDGTYVELSNKFTVYGTHTIPLIMQHKELK